MNEQLRTEARRLLLLKDFGAEGVRRWCCTRHSHKAIEDRPDECDVCHKELIGLLLSGADANRSLVKWRDDAAVLLREAFGLAAADGKEP